MDIEDFEIDLDWRDLDDQVVAKKSDDPLDSTTDFELESILEFIT